MKKYFLVNLTQLVFLGMFVVQTVKAQHARVDSCHLVGADWKNGTGGKTQDFEKACHYFQQGAEKGYVMSSYDYGFMLYIRFGMRAGLCQGIENVYDRSKVQSHSESLHGRSVLSQWIWCRA